MTIFSFRVIFYRLTMACPGLCSHNTAYRTSLPSTSFFLQPPPFVAKTKLTDLEILVPEPIPCDVPDGCSHPCSPPAFCYHEPPVVVGFFETSLHEV